MSVIEVGSFEAFQTIIARDEVSIFDFWAPWCGPCRIISPVFENLSKSYPLLKFYKLDTEAVPVAAAAVQIRTLPTFIAFRGGKKLDSFSGAVPQLLKQFLSKMEQEASNAPAEKAPSSPAKAPEDAGLSMMEKLQKKAGSSPAKSSEPLPSTATSGPMEVDHNDENQGIPDAPVAGNVHVVKTLGEFTEIINKDEVSLIDFWAPWCGPSKIMSPVFAELSTDYSKLKFYKVNAEALGEAAEQFHIQSLPAFASFRSGKKLDVLHGSIPAKLEEWIEKQSKLASGETTTAPPTSAPAEKQDPAPGSVTQITDVEGFNVAVKRPNVSIIDFWASWCGPCRAIAPVYENLAKKYSHINFYKLNGEEVPAVTAHAGIRAYPTFLAFRDGKFLDAFGGAMPKQLEAWITSLSPGEQPKQQESAKSDEAPAPPATESKTSEPAPAEPAPAKTTETAPTQGQSQLSDKKVTSVHSLEKFKEIIKSDTPVVFDFWAPWCGPCKIMSPIFENLATKYPIMKFYKLDIEELPDVAHDAKIRTLPAFAVYQNGEKQGEFKGAKPGPLGEFLKEHAEKKAPAPTEPAAETKAPSPTQAPAPAQEVPPAPVPEPKQAEATSTAPVSDSAPAVPVATPSSNAPSSPPGVVTPVKSYEDFKAIIERDEPSIFDFWAPWCGPCRIIGPVYENLSKNYPTLKFYKLDTEEVERVGPEVGIRAMPVFMAFREGAKIGEMKGAKPLDLRAFLDKQVELAAAEPTSTKAGSTDSAAMDVDKVA